MSAQPPLHAFSSPEAIVRRRWAGLLIWQSIAATFLFFSYSLALRRLSVALTLLSFLAFHVSNLFFTLAAFLLVSPSSVEAADFTSVVAAVFRLVFAGEGIPPPVKRRAAEGFLLVASVVSGFIGIPALCGDESGVTVVGMRGAILGFIFAVHYLYGKRWILGFPIVQRSFYFTFRRGLLALLKRALKLSLQCFIPSLLVMLFLPKQFKSDIPLRSRIMWECRILTGVFVVSFCWEISLHLLQVLHTRRNIFAPYQGSAEAATNPSEILLDVLEQSAPKSLLKHLAYLDLCIVLETNAEAWRRAAFFEETGETFKRVVTVCLQPTKLFTLALADGLVGFYGDQQDALPPKQNSVEKLYEAFNESQLCSWCARSIAALIARSHQDDTFGVAQRTDSISAVISTLLSALVAVEACLGKRTNAQNAQMPGPENIRWATAYTGRRESLSVINPSKRKGELHKKAYVMADVLRTSIYQIVSAFEDDMKANVDAAVLEKKWIGEGKPLFGSRAVLLYKLRLFISHRAV